MGWLIISRSAIGGCLGYKEKELNAETQRPQGRRGCFPNPSFSASSRPQRLCVKAFALARMDKNKRRDAEDVFPTHLSLRLRGLSVSALKLLLLPEWTKTNAETQRRQGRRGCFPNPSFSASSRPQRLCVKAFALARMDKNKRRDAKTAGTQRMFSQPIFLCVFASSASLR
jgi:hypothetical protein